MVHSFFNNKIFVKTGDITKENSDAIVNAANSSLMGGGGVDGAIHRKGGPEILKECKNIIRTQFPDGLPTGKAVITTAGLMPSNYVIHTVGPIWSLSKNPEKLLSDAYLNSLKCAKKNHCKSVTFPAISTGVYGFPKELAAQISSKTVIDFFKNNDEIEQVIFIFFSEEDMDVFIDNAQFSEV